MPQEKPSEFVTFRTKPEYQIVELQFTLKFQSAGFTVQTQPISIREGSPMTVPRHG